MSNEMSKSHNARYRNGIKHEVTPGDWIITGVEGEVYACKPDIFEQTYEPAV